MKLRYDERSPERLTRVLDIVALLDIAICVVALLALGASALPR